MNFEKKYLKYKTKYLELKNQIGGDPISDILEFAREKNMTVDEFHKFIINVNYYKKKIPDYDDKGIHNPMIIGNYVVKAIGHRGQLNLEARPKLETDTSEAMMAMANVSDTVYIDKENASKYVVVNSIFDD